MKKNLIYIKTKCKLLTSIIKKLKLAQYLHNYPKLLDFLGRLHIIILVDQTRIRQKLASLHLHLTSLLEDSYPETQVLLRDRRRTCLRLTPELLLDLLEELDPPSVVFVHVHQIREH